MLQREADNRPTAGHRQSIVVYRLRGNSRVRRRGFTSLFGRLRLVTALVRFHDTAHALSGDDICGEYLHAQEV